MDDSSTGSGDWIAANMDAVRRMFTDGKFSKIPNTKYLYTVTFNGSKVGVIFATYNANFGNYSLNCGELKRLLDALKDGKIQIACVFKVRFEEQTNRRTIVDVLDAIEMQKMLEGVAPREGSYGAFWTLPSSDAEAW